MKNYLKKTERTAINEFVNRVKTRFGDKINSIILFGSKVWGNFNQDSDIDILVITNVKKNDIAKEIVDIAFDIMLEKGPYISAKVFYKNYVEAFYSQGDAFIKNVVDKGEKL